MTKKQIDGLVYASFIGDALSLSTHWNYNVEELKQKYDTITAYETPTQPTYHPHKKAGELTHYGDQMSLLLNHQTFDKDTFYQEWKKLFENYTDYIDHCTKAALSGTNPGVSGFDLSVVGRIAPLFAQYSDKKELEEKAKQMAAITHPPKEIEQTIEYFINVVYAIMEGMKPSKALEVTEKPEMISLLIEQGLAGENPGNSCAITSSLPSTIHTIKTQEDSLMDAFTETILQGGDNAARAIIIGMVLGAYHGVDKIPTELIDTLSVKQKIEKALN